MGTDGQWSGAVMGDRTAVHITRGLAEGLVAFAADAEPSSVSLGLEVTAAGDLDREVDLDGTVPVFTHFVHPDAGGSTSAVFGIDLGTPVGRTRGRFVSHPQGKRGVELTDDLHAVVIVAVPPWEVDGLAAFDRRGRRVGLVLVEAEPPEEELPE